MIKDKIKSQLSNLKSDCTYTAEAHHQIANRSNRVDFGIRIIPAILTGVTSSGEIIFQPESNFLIIITLILAVTTAITNVIGAKEKYTLHLSTAKKFTRIKKLCDKVIEVDILYVTDSELKKIYENLLNEYLQIVDEAPPTEGWAFKKAQERIQKDKVHEPD